MRVRTSGLWGLVIVYFLTWVVVVSAFSHNSFSCTRCILYFSWLCYSSIKRREKRLFSPTWSLCYLSGTEQACDLHPTPYPGVARYVGSLWSVARVPQAPLCTHFYLRAQPKPPSLTALQNLLRVFFLGPTH